MATISTMRALAVLAALAVFGCTSRDSSRSSESAASVAGPSAQASAGSGHLQLTGDATVDTDFAVAQCTVGPAGEGLLNGYHMVSKAGRGTIQMIALAVKSYERDGEFTPSVDTVARTTAMLARSVSGPLAMTIGRENSTVPLPVITKPESRLTITISDSGSSGSAEFSELTSPVAMEDVDIKSPTHAKRKSFAGSLTWHCPTVQHVDAATSDAAKAMTKGLTPIH